MLTDLRHSLRALRARRFDTFLGVALLTLGLTTTGAIFAVADALLIHPAPFPQPDRLVQVWSSIGESSFVTMPRELAPHWLDRTDLFSAGGVYTQTSALVTGNGEPELIGAAEVSPGLFETLGIHPILGRTFSAEEGRAGTNRVVVIGAELWAARFGASADAIGRVLRINGADHTVVGVMPATFRFPFSRQRVWLPFDVRNPPPQRQNIQVTVVARTRPGLTREQLKDQVVAAGPGIAKLATRPWKMGATPHYMDDVLMDRQTRRSIWMLFGATVLLMLTVCANVANIGLSQAFSRARDAAIRSALGASRARMIRQTMVEQLIVGVAALSLSLPLVTVALRVAAGMLPANYTVSSLNPVDVDARLIVVLSLLAILTPVLSGLVPAIAGTRASLTGALTHEGRAVTGSRGARVFRRGLVVTEVACSVVLLVSAALLVRSFMKLQAVDKGFDSRNLVTANLGFQSAYFPDGVSRDLYIDEALTRLRQLPGVTAVTTATGVPPENGGIQFGNIELEGRPSPKGEVISSMYEVQPDFFATVGVPILRGRALAPDEPKGNLVISESMAAKFWPGEDVVGRRFRWDGGEWQTVIGVAATVRESVSGNERWPQTYWPLQRHTPSSAPPRDAISGWQRIALRVDDPATAMPRVRSALRQINAGVVIDKIDRVDDLLAKDLDRPRFLLALMLVFAAAGLVLAAVGLYGVLSCLVAEQLREYGIRLMLGAQPGGIARAIVGSALLTTAAGLVVGGAVAAALGKTINAVLFEVDARDVVSYAVVAVALMLAALVAAWRPARMAARVDPTTLLR